ncbi:MOSC domain-containing protein [Sphingosinicella terrae]|uniref:MOSC domain-containing protein n=1 Tax=Sphingosinicella terrae TaxID=2172047 RepID=UPI000E0E007F|nr:MOSC N-terminal beta barrel domain-containing protein [Sphingosinicella terrae]
MGEVVGRVVEINRYPVKSMAADPVTQADIDWQGIEGDRQYAFYRSEDRSRFPWMTARELPEMVRFAPRYRDPEDPKMSPVDVRDAEGRWSSLHDVAFLDRLALTAGCPLGLMQLGRGTHDAMPVSVVTTTTHAAVDAAHGSAVDPRRFRSNIVVEADVREDRWAGRRLGFGGWDDAAELLVTEMIPRCAFVTLCPDSGARDPAIMRTVAQAFDNKIGIYATAARQGRVRLGDKVMLLG